MAEFAATFGIVTGVIGLIPICGQGCSFIEKIFKADNHAKEQLIRIQMQKWDLDAWARVWEIPNVVPKRKTDSKLQRFIEKDRSMGYNMLRTLSVISHMFVDIRELQTKYGIHLKHRDSDLQHFSAEAIFGHNGDLDQVQKKIENRRQRMNILERCSFELQGTSKFDTFIERLKESIAALRNICSEVQAMQLNRALPDHVSNNPDPSNLETVSRVYGEEVEKRRKAGQQAKGPELIRDIAAFKARAQHLVRKRYELLEKRRNSNQEKSFLLSGSYLNVEDFEIKEALGGAGSTKVSLAMEKGAQKARYIEWKPYAYEVVTETDHYDFKARQQIDKKAEDDIMALSDFFHVTDRPGAFRILPFLGIFRDEEQRRFGFVFEPPAYIENLEGHGTIKGEAAKRRTPKSLLEQLESDNRHSRPFVLPLGDRFKLASLLAESLYVLHAAGWVHKNIRSSSVVFLPHESTYGGVPSTTGAKDTTKPYLCGFGHSRPGQLPEKTPPPTPQKKFPQRSETYWNITLDEYHHPSKRVNSALSYTQACDLYSLGVVLLELGLWQPLSTFSATMNLRNDPEVLREHLQKIARNELPAKLARYMQM